MTRSALFGAAGIFVVVLFVVFTSYRGKAAANEGAGKPGESIAEDMDRSLKGNPAPTAPIPCITCPYVYGFFSGAWDDREDCLNNGDAKCAWDVGTGMQCNNSACYSGSGGDCRYAVNAIFLDECWKNPLTNNWEAVCNCFCWEGPKK